MSSQFIRPWTKDKLELLDKYLRAYSQIMHAQKSQKSKWLRSYVYVDAFANVGIYRDPETREYVEGSPLVALRCEPPFDEYWFIELSPPRLDSLRANVETLPNRDRVHFVTGDANEVLVETISRGIRYENFERGLVFLDPYGLQVWRDTVRHLAGARAFDIFVNFPIMAINRLLDQDQRPRESSLALLARIVGEATWAEEMYASQPDLFGEVHYMRGASRAEVIAETYINKVRELFGHASTPVIMRNSTNSPLYALFLASHQELAVKITNDIFRRYRRSLESGAQDSR